MSRFTKALISATVTAVMMTSMCITASAATKSDVIAAAKATGVPDIYVQQLTNYLNVVSFTPEQYDKMVALANSYKGISDEKAQELYQKYAGELSSSEKEDIYKGFSAEQKAEILNKVAEVGGDVDVNITVDKVSDKRYSITATDKDGKVVTVINAGQFVDQTGEKDYTPYAVAGVGATLLLASAAALSVLNRKNKKHN